MKLLYKAKRLDNNEWVEGCYLIHERPIIPMGVNQHTDKHFIVKTGFADWNMTRPLNGHEVDPKTVSQWTGFHDADGTAIFAGDKFKVGRTVYEVIWDNLRGQWALYDGYVIVKPLCSINLLKCTIMGNVHDNNEATVDVKLAEELRELVSNYRGTREEVLEMIKQESAAVLEGEDAVKRLIEQLKKENSSQ